MFLLIQIWGPESPALSLTRVSSEHTSVFILHGLAAAAGAAAAPAAAAAAAVGHDLRRRISTYDVVG